MDVGLNYASNVVAEGVLRLPSDMCFRLLPRLRVVSRSDYLLSARQIIGVGYCYGPKGHNSGVCKVIFRAMCEDVDGRGSSGVY